jgi:alanyl-tRNA synthetase
LESLKKERLGDTLGDLLAGAVDAGGVLLIRQVFDDMETDEMRALTDQIRQREKNSVAVLISKAGGKVTIITAVSDALMEKGLHAGRLIKEIAAAAGGGGGGKADLAQAGAKDPGKIEAAMTAALEAIRQYIASNPF